LKAHQFQSGSWQGSPPVLIASGDGYHTAEVLNKARKGLEETFPEAIHEKLEAPARRLGEAIDLYHTHGMWGETRIVEFHAETNNQGFWAPKVENKGNDEQQHLLDCLEGEPSGNILLIRCGAIRASKWAKALKEKAFMVDCAVPKESRRDQTAWIMGQGREIGLDITQDGAYALIDRIGNNPGVLDNALAMLDLSPNRHQRWGSMAIEKVFTRDTQSDVFRLAEALSSQDMKASLQVSTSLFDRGTQIVELIGGLRVQFKRLLQLKFNEGKWDKDAICRELGIPHFFVDKTRQQASRFSLPRLKQVYNELHRLDRSIKSSSQNERDLFEVFIFRCFFGT
jgi:DNA polymerase III delta subunit